MTVAELRIALSNRPDDTQVCIVTPQGYDEPSVEPLLFSHLHDVMAVIGQVNVEIVHEPQRKNLAKRFRENMKPILVLGW